MRNLFFMGILFLTMVQHSTVAQIGRNYTSITEGMQQPDSVVWFTMRGMGITVVPEEIRQFKNLKYLDFSFNSIEVVPGFINEFKHLVYLDFSSNQITQLPEDWSSLTSLRNVYISFKHARYFEASAVQLAQLPNLKVLHLNAPGLVEWPDALSTLQQLEYVSLKETQLRKFPVSITGMRNLQYISISNSHNFDLVASITVLSQLPKLQELHIADNHTQQTFYYASKDFSAVYRQRNSTNPYWKETRPNSRETLIYMNPEQFMAPGGTESDSPLK